MSFVNKGRSLILYFWKSVGEIEGHGTPCFNQVELKYN